MIICLVYLDAGGPERQEKKPSSKTKKEKNLKEELFFYTFLVLYISDKVWNVPGY